MSAPSSPGRTWPILAIERQLPVLAGTVAVRVHHAGGGRVGLRGLAGAPAAPVPPDVGNAGYPLGEYRHQHIGAGSLGRAVVPLSMTVSRISFRPMRRCE